MAEKKTSFIYELDGGQQEKLLALFASCGFKERNVPYSIAAVEGDGFNAALYQKEKHGKRKLCIQGGKADEFVEFYLEPQVLETVGLGYEDVLDPDRDKPHCGCDESGKGDYFGPLVVACCYVDEPIAKALREMGARDCKQMSDKSVLAVGAKARHLLGPNRYAVLRLNPPAYNRLYAKIKNINRLLAWAHGSCLENLLEKQPACPKAVIDQFAPTETTIRRALKERGKKIEVIQRHKAESDIAVAVASVIAREIFLRALVDDLPAFGNDVPANPESPIDVVPKGSSDPRVKKLAEARVRATEPKWLMNHCKAHFKTTDQVLEACGLTREALPEEGRVKSAVPNGAFGGFKRKNEKKAEGDSNG